MGKVVTREWRKAKVLNWNLHSFQLLGIIKVLDSISWVRCASGNVFHFIGIHYHSLGPHCPSVQPSISSDV